MNGTHPLVTDYLDRLSTLLDDLDPGDRAEILDGVREHLDAALASHAAAGDDGVRAVLDELGTPDDVAREAHADLPARTEGATPDVTLGAAPRRRGRWLVSALAALGLFAMLVVVPWQRPAPGPVEPPVFPSALYPYSWWNGPLSTARIDAATALFDVSQDDILLDAQAVLLGTDGASYRELDLARRLGSSPDLGNPAPSALSPDGTFVVIGNSAGTGTIRVLTLRDGARRTVEVGEDRTAHPLAIGDDGRTVLFGTRSGPHVNPRTTDLRLTRLDLKTGEMTEYPNLAVEAAALSPDGSRMVVRTAGPTHLRLVDADGGPETVIPGLGFNTRVSSGAWAPDGSRFAVVSGGELAIVDPERPSSPRRLGLGDSLGATAIGWRDESTVLLRVDRPGGSYLAWADAATGAVEPFSHYRASTNDTSIYALEVARDLIPSWNVEHGLEADRGGLPIAVAAGISLAVGLLIWLLYPRRRTD